MMRGICLFNKCNKYFGIMEAFLLLPHIDLDGAPCEVEMAT